MFLRKNNKNIENNTINEEGKNKKDIIKLFSFDSNYFKKEKYKEDEEALNVKSMSFRKKIKNNMNNSLLIKRAQCPLGKECPYYKQYIELKNKLRILFHSIKKENNFQKLLMKSLSKKKLLYYNLISENEDLKKLLYFLTNKRILDFSKYEYNYTDKNNENISFKTNNYSLTEKNNSNYNTKISKSIIENNSMNKKNKKNFSKKLLLNKNISIDNTNNTITTSNNYNSYDKKVNQIRNINKNNNSINLKLPKKLSKNYIRSNILSMNSDPNQHYQLLQHFSKNQNRKLMGENYSKLSFLSSNIDYATIINNNNIIKNLHQLTKNDEDFIRTMTESSNESLLKICDMIISLINDYKEIAKLGIKMKDLINCSNKFIDSILDCNPSEVLIENTCFILNCDRASLFTLDKNSDSLIVYQAEGIKKAQIKVPKDKGVVGSCFLERKKIRIDDAYLDKRFNQDIDKKTNYRTKSILCYPLLDRNGECFGVIEAINKVISSFNEDDEELLKILAYQASIIFSNFSKTDDHRFINKQLNIIIDYAVEINYIKNKFELSEVTEDYLLNIFNCVESAFFFVEDNMIRKYKDNKIINYNINYGIVGRSIKTKDILTFQNIKKCAEFNPIVDLNITDALLTFPILGKKSKIVKGVVQVPYFGKIFKNGKPNENIMKIIKKFRKCVKNWFAIHESSN